MLSGSWLASVLCAFWPWVCCCVLMWGVWPNSVSVSGRFERDLNAIWTCKDTQCSHAQWFVAGCCSVRVLALGLLLCVDVGCLA
jgi:hypothetical protein